MIKDFLRISEIRSGVRNWEAEMLASARRGPSGLAMRENVGDFLPRYYKHGAPTELEEKRRWREAWRLGFLRK